jgi:hypothetical protein
VSFGVKTSLFVKKVRKLIKNVKKQRSGFYPQKIPQDIPQVSPVSQRNHRVTVLRGLSYSEL